MEHLQGGSSTILRTMSSKMLLVLVPLLLVDLFREVVGWGTVGMTGGVCMFSADEETLALAPGVGLCDGAERRGRTGVVVGPDGVKGCVCVKHEEEGGLGAKRGGGGGEQGVADGTSETLEAGTGSGGLAMFRVRGTVGGGDGAGGMCGGDGCGGGQKEGEGKKERGDKLDSSFSISFSSFTRLGGSTPYLAAIRPSSIRQRHTSRGCLCRTVIKSA